MEDNKKGFFDTWLFPILIIVVVLLVVVFVFNIIKYREIKRLNMEAPISVPYFKTGLKPGTRITEEMMGYDEMPYKDYLEKYEGKIVLEKKEIFGKCVKKEIVNETYIYKDNLVECSNNE